MTNCFFTTIQQAFRPKDFYAHFPKFEKEEIPLGVFDPYFQNLQNLASFLGQLVEFLISMYGYTKLNDGSEHKENKGKEMHYVSSHVLVNGSKVGDRELGEFLHMFHTKEIKLEEMLAKGHYDGHGAFDPILVLLCEFSGVGIHVKFPAHTQLIQFPNKPSTRIKHPEHVFRYSRLNTLVQTKVHIQFVEGHASFQSRHEQPLKNPRKRKLI